MSSEMSSLRSGIMRLKRESENHKRAIRSLQKERDLLLERSKYLAQKLNEAYAVYEEAGKRILDFTEKETGPLKGRIQELAEELKKFSRANREWKSSLEERISEIVKRLERSDAVSFQRLESTLEQVNKRIAANETLSKSIASEMGARVAELDKKLAALARAEDAAGRQFSEFRSAAERRLKEDKAALEKDLTELKKSMERSETVLRARLESAEIYSKNLSQRLEKAVAEFRKILAETRVDEKRTESSIAEFRSFLEDKLKLNKEFFEKGIERVARDAEKLNRESCSRMSESLNRLDKRLTASENAIKQAEFAMKDFSKKLAEASLDEKRIESRFSEIKEHLEDSMKLTRDILEKKIENAFRESARAGSDAEKALSKSRKELETRIANTENFASKIGLMLENVKKEFASGLKNLDKKIVKAGADGERLSEKLNEFKLSSETMIKTAEDSIRKSVDSIRDESWKRDSKLEERIGKAEEDMKRFEKTLADMAAKIRSDLAEFSRQLSFAKQREDKNRQRIDDVRNVVDGLIKAEGNVFDSKLNDFSRMADKKMLDMSSSLKASQQKLASRLDALEKTADRMQSDFSGLAREMEKAGIDEKRIESELSEMKGFLDMQLKSVRDGLDKKINDTLRSSETRIKAAETSLHNRLSVTDRRLDERLSRLKDDTDKSVKENRMLIEQTRSGMEMELLKGQKALKELSEKLGGLEKALQEERFTEKHIEGMIDSLGKDFENKLAGSSRALAQEIESLEDRVAKQDAGMQGLLKRMSELEKTMQSDRLDDKLFNSKLEALRKDMADEIQKSRSFFQGIQRDVENFKNQIRESTLTGKEIQDKLDSLRDFASRKDSEIAFNVGRLQTDMEKRLDSFEKAMVSVNSRLSELGRKASAGSLNEKNLKNIIESLRREFERKQKEFSDAVGQQTSSLLKRIETAEITERMLSDKIEEIKNEVQKSRLDEKKLDSRIALSQQDIRQKLLDYKSLNKEFAKSLEEMKNTIQGMRLGLSKDRNSIKSLSDRLDSLVTSEQNLFEKQLKEHDADVQIRMENELSKVTSAQQDISSRINALESATKNALSRISELKKDAQISGIKDSELESTISSLANRMDSIDADFSNKIITAQENLSSRISSLESALKSHKQITGSIKRELQNEINSLSSKIGKAGIEDSVLEGMIKRIEPRLENRVKAAADALEAKFREADSRFTRKALDEIAGMRAERLKLEKRIESFEGLVSGMNSAISSLRKEISGRMLDQKTLEQKIESSRTQLGAKEAVLEESLNSQIRELGNRIARLENEKSNLYATVSGIAKQAEILSKKSYDPEEIKARVRRSEGLVRQFESKLSELRKRTDTILSEILDKLESQKTGDAGSLKQLREQIEARMKLNDEIMNAELARMRKEFARFMKDMAVMNEKQQERLYKILKE